MNKVILMGRLTRDPDIRAAQNSETQIAKFTLAVDRRGRKDSGEQNADFISCTAFGKTADFIERYCRRGTKLCLEGRIQTGSYTGRDGSRVYTTDVVVENAEFAESRQQGQTEAQQGAPSQYAQAAPAQNGYAAQAPQQQAYRPYGQAQQEQPSPAPGFFQMPAGSELPFA